MRKLLNKPWFVATLAIAAIALVAWQSMDWQTFSAPAVAVFEDTTAVEEPTVAGEDAALLALLNTYASHEGLRDPFAGRIKPVSAEPTVSNVEVKKESFRLSAVWIQGARVLALINDRIYAPGDSLGLLQLETISRDGAWISHRGGREFLGVGHEIALAVPTSLSAPAPLVAAREL